MMHFEENTCRYDDRILGIDEKITNDARKTGISNNVMVVASSGAGKTGSYLYPNIKSAQNQSLIVSDSKGQLSRIFREELIAKGYDVQVISLIDWTRSAAYNPLDYIRRAPNGSVRYQDVIVLSQALIPIETPKDPFWERSAQIVLQFLIGYTLEALPPEDWNMNAICQLYHVMLSSKGLASFEQWTKNHPASFPAMKLKEISNFAPAEKMMASILAFVNNALAPFELEEAKTIFQNKNAVNLHDLGRRKTALFLEVSDCDHSFDRIQNILFTQVIQVLFQDADQNPDGRLSVPVTLMMDDFAANMNIPDFDRLLSVTRSRDIGVTIILQSLSQLSAIYGTERALTIQNNCDTIIYMGAQDLDTARFIGFHAHRDEYSILSMPRDKEYVLMAGQKAKLISKLPPYSYEPECTGTSPSNSRNDDGFTEEKDFPF